MYSGSIDARSLAARWCSSSKKEDEAMKYLKDLIERLGKALRIKISPQMRAGSTSRHASGSIPGPVQQDR